jgi:hypothetical protein
LPGSVVFDTAIGLIFVFLTASLICSAAVEWVANKLNKRGEYLLRGLRELLDIPPATPSAPRSQGTSAASDVQGLLEKGKTRERLQEFSNLGREFRTQLAMGNPTVLRKAPLADLVLAHPIIADSGRRAFAEGQPGRRRVCGTERRWRSDSVVVTAMPDDDDHAPHYLRAAVALTAR